MEIVKLLLLLALLIAFQTRGSIVEASRLIYSEIICRPHDTLLLAIPSALYIVQDNLIIFGLACLDAATYQATYQIRILTTALFARVLLQKVLTAEQWFSLFVLMAGVILAQFNYDNKTGDFSFRSHKEGSQYIIGLLAVITATFTSGFAGVFNEKLFKNGAQPLLLVRSLQLSIFCTTFAFFVVMIKDGGQVIQKGFFYGYSPFVFFIAFMQASGGIIVAATMKFADNILKTFATSISIVLSCVLSYVILGDLNITPTFLIGTLAIIWSTLLYNRQSQSRSIVSDTAISNARNSTVSFDTSLPCKNVVGLRSII